MSTVTALTALAVAAYASPPQPLPDYFQYMQSDDPVLDWLSASAYQSLPSALPEMQGALDAITSDPDLSDLRQAKEGELDLFISTPRGGSRQNPEAILHALVASARQQIGLRHLDNTESAFVRLVLEGYEELLHALAGEPVRAYTVVGFAGVTLPQEAQVQTPWGVLRAAPPAQPTVRAFASGLHMPTTVFLMSPELLPVTLTREAEPAAPGVLDEARRTEIQMLLPLAFALATAGGTPCAPVATFETSLVPFKSGLGWSSTVPWMPLRPAPEPSVSEREAVESWSHTLVQREAPNLEISIKRTLSSISGRRDPSDSLIDAVTAWESVVGTRSETVFRVTAALAKLLEADSTARAELRKRLAKIYDVRSRVVHGDLVEVGDVASAAADATSVSLRTLAALFERGDDWLAMKASERSDRLILGP